MMRIILATIAFVMLAMPSWGSDYSPEFERLSWQQSEKIIAQGRIVLILLNEINECLSITNIISTTLIQSCSHY